MKDETLKQTMQYLKLCLHHKLTETEEKNISSWLKNAFRIEFNKGYIKAMTEVRQSFTLAQNEDVEKCPECGSTKLETTTFTGDDNHLHTEAVCKDCGATFTS